MGRVANFRFGAGVVLVALIAMLALFARGSSVTEATTFTPSAGLVVVDPTPGANSSITMSTVVPSGQGAIQALDYINFIPPQWTIANDASIPDGSIIGSATAFVALGGSNAFCGVLSIPIGFAFMEATTNTGGPQVAFNDTDADGQGDWFERWDGASMPGGVPPDIRIRRAVTEYPDKVAPLFSVAPRLRLFGPLSLGGTDIGVNVLIFNPGDLLPTDASFTTSRGYPVVTLIQELGVPGAAGTPGSILTDGPCTPFTANITVNGLATWNPCTAYAGPPCTNAGGLPTGGSPAPFTPISELQNPGAGSYNFSVWTRSNRDYDNDGIENGLDTCPATVNTDASPRTPGAPAPQPLMIATSPLPVPSTQDPDGWIDLFYVFGPAVNMLGSNPLTGLPGGFVSDISAPEGIDSSCDSGPASPCGPSPADNFLAQDCDTDGFLNRADNCPQVANGTVGGVVVPSTQADTDLAYPGPASDGGPVIDSIGNACDTGSGLSPTVPDGHFHVSDLTQSVDIGKHGVKFNNVGGPPVTQPNTTKNYSIEVNNQDSDDAQDAKVQLSIAVANGNCPAPTIDGQAVTSLVKTATAIPADGSQLVSFSVAFGACSDGGASANPDYIITGDACHPGDPAPKGFGAAACPGTADGHNAQDSNPLNDAPATKSVNE